MALSPVIDTYLKQIPAVSTSDILSIEELRKAFDERQRKINAEYPFYDLKIQDEIALTSYGPTPIRVYRPPVDEPRAALIFFHGGGFVFGNLETLEVYCRDLANSFQCVVISVDYPLAPENPFPAAPESCYAAACWIYDNLGKWNGIPQKCFVGGSSAGATLATVVTLMIKERGGPKLSGQILLCPMTDTDFETASYCENAEGYNLTRDKCIWFYSKYIPEGMYTHSLVAPLRARDLRNVPRALIVTAEYDPLKDEGRAYARKLKNAGIDCWDICYPGMIHGFYTLPLDLAENKDLMTNMSKFMHSH